MSHPAQRPVEKPSQGVRRVPSHLEILINPLYLFRSAGPRLPARVLSDSKLRGAFRRLRVWALGYVLSSALLVAAAVTIPLSEDDGGRLGIVLRSAGMAVVALVIFWLASMSQRGSRNAFRYLRVLACLESVGFVVVSLVIPGDPTEIKIAKAVIGVLAIGTAVASLSPTIGRAFKAPTDQ